MIPLTIPEINFKEIEKDLKKVLKSGILTKGPKAKQFEKMVAKYVGTKYAFATTSATTALHLSLVALGIGSADEVLVADFTFPATANVVVQQGAKPVLVDINLDNYNIDIKDLERKNAFIIFPTVDSIKWISGYLDIVNADKIKGSLIFKYKELTDVAEVKKDIHFFAEIFRRCFRANGLNFTQEMISHSDFIDLNFEVSGLRIFMVGLLTKEKEGY